MSVMLDAHRLVYGDRADDYGDPRTEAQRIASGWSAILGCDVPAEAYPLCMAWVKIVRQVNRPKRDNLVDLAGYAGLAEKLEQA